MTRDDAPRSTWTSASNAKNRELAIERWEDDGGRVVVSVAIETVRVEAQPRSRSRAS